jgi:hypothetical protein
LDADYRRALQRFIIGAEDAIAEALLQGSLDSPQHLIRFHLCPSLGRNADIDSSRVRGQAHGGIGHALQVLDSLVQP